MVQFLTAIPNIVLYGCVSLIVATLMMTLWMVIQASEVRTQLGRFKTSMKTSTRESVQRRNGLSLANLDEFRVKTEELTGTPAVWWKAIDHHIEQYTSPEEIEGWFLTEQPRKLLPYEALVGRNFNSSLFGAFPGLLTGAGLTLTFIAILLSLYGVHYDKSNTVAPITGIDDLINGLSGKFLSSIIALLLSIFFTLFEKRTIRGLRAQYEELLATVSEAVPYLSSARILLDIQRFAAKQTVSVSHISSEVVDRLVGSFNSEVVPKLTEGMSAGVAQKMESEFRPTMQQMNDTLAELKAAILGLEVQKQESITGELRGFFETLEASMVKSLSKMGDDFHSSLTGAASQEFGNVQGTLEATRTMLSEMNAQFGAMQAAFFMIIEKAEKATADQMSNGREQTEALTALMNGLMTRMQESADQNLNSVRTQLTLVVSDLAEKVGSLSQDITTAAQKVTEQSQKSTEKVLKQTGNWSESTAQRLEALLGSIETRSTEFQAAGKSLIKARDYVAEILKQNGDALKSMAEASQHVQTYSSGLAGQAESLKSLAKLHTQITTQMRETSENLKASTELNGNSLAEYRRSIEDYRRVINEMDQSIAKILGVIQKGLRDYNASIENNFQELVKISNPMISEASSFLQTQIEELSGQLEELGSVISTSMERMNGRPN